MNRMVLAVAVLFLLSGCTSVGSDLVRMGDHGYRMGTIANSNVLEHTVGYSVLEKCAVEEVVETLTYQIEDEDTGLSETVTEETVTYESSNCVLVRTDHVASPGFGPALIGSAVQGAAIAYAGHQVGKGIKNAAGDNTSIDNSSENNSKLKSSVKSSVKASAKGGKGGNAYAEGGNSYSKAYSGSSANAKAGAFSKSESKNLNINIGEVEFD